MLPNGLVQKPDWGRRATWAPTAEDLLDRGCVCRAAGPAVDSSVTPVLVPAGELLDGQRGLVPSNFVDFVQDSESRLASTLASEQDQNLINHSGIGVGVEGERILDLHSPTLTDLGTADLGGDSLDVNIDDIGEDIVPYPRRLTLIKQLAKSVIVGWEPPAVPPGWGTVSGYTVLVDTEPRLSLPLGARTKALVEKLDTAAFTYRISVQCVTSRGASDALQCTLLVGRDVVVAPSHLRVDSITQTSAQLSWLPTNSNYSHAIFLNGEEVDVVRAARYKYQFLNLRPNAAYKVGVVARPHQMPWQLPLEQREKKEASVEFSTLPAGEPRPSGHPLLPRCAVGPAWVLLCAPPRSVVLHWIVHGIAESQCVSPCCVRAPGSPALCCLSTLTGQGPHCADAAGGTLVSRSHVVTVESGVHAQVTFTTAQDGTAAGLESTLSSGRCC